MSEDVLSQPFDDKVKGAFGARLAAHLQAKGQGNGSQISGGLGSHARRLNAWCVISKDRNDSKSGNNNNANNADNSKVSLSMNTNGFDSRYPVSSKRKPSSPSLKKVTINRVTTYAERINLTVEILVEFEVYTYDAFQTYANEFLRRPEDGKPITITFGHVDLDSQGRGIGECIIRDVWVIGGGYTQEESKWMCSFKAIAPASAALIVDMSQTSSAIPPNLTFKAKTALKSRTLKVGSLHEYILFALQSNGNKLTENLSDGEEVASSNTRFTSPIGKVYKPFEGSPVAKTGALTKLLGAGKEAVDGVDTGAVEYISLLFVVELINRFVLEPTNKKQKGLELKIELLPDSVSWVPGRYFKSAYPTSVLFLSGVKGGSGTYKSDGDAAAGKDFEIGGKYFGGCVKGYTCYHDKILISRRAVIAPLIEALNRIDDERAKSKKEGKAFDMNSFKSKIITVGSFFDALFRMIQSASGSYVNLCFTHLKDSFTGDKKTHILRIDNCSYISKDKPYIHTLRPITGDGNTLSVNITGKLPDSMVGLAILSSGGHGSDTATEMSPGSENQDERKRERDIVLNSLVNTSTTADPPGVYAKIAESNFAEADMSAASLALQNAKNLSKPSAWQGGPGWTEFFEVEMSATMEGAFPILVGNRFTAEGLPQFVTVEKKLCFVALDIVDTIEAPGVWTTEIKTKLCHV